MFVYLNCGIKSNASELLWVGHMHSDEGSRLYVIYLHACGELLNLKPSRLHILSKLGWWERRAWHINSVQARFRYFQRSVPAFYNTRHDHCFGDVNFSSLKKDLK